MDYAGHIHDLIAQHRIPVTWGSQAGGSYADATGAIHIAPVTDATTYWTALHEIGHVVTGDVFKYAGISRLEFEARALNVEANAWVWALDNALPGAESPANLIRWGMITHGVTDGPPAEISDELRRLAREYLADVDADQVYAFGLAINNGDVWIPRRQIESTARLMGLALAS